MCFYSKVSRPDKLAVHVFEVDEDVDKDEVSLCPVCVKKVHAVILLLDCVFTGKDGVLVHLSFLPFLFPAVVEVMKGSFVSNGWNSVQLHFFF